MSFTVLGAIASIVAIFSAISTWLWRRTEAVRDEIHENRDTVKELMEAKLSAVGRSLDEVKRDIRDLTDIVTHHDKKIAQGDIVMVHIDETMKKLTEAVGKLDETLRIIQINLAEKKD